MILGPVGMILVGLVSIGFWRLKRGVGFRYFVLGGLTMISAITPKLILDLTATSALSSWAETTFGSTGWLILVGAYVGLRTGFFECGFTYIAFSKTKLRNMSLDEAIAFGVGFGAFEAVLIAIPSLIQILVFMTNPSILDALPPTERQMAEAQLSMPTWIVPAPIIERVFTILAHVFTTLLIFSSVREGKTTLFLGAFIYKALLDGVIPYLQRVLKPSTSPVGTYLAEIWVVFMGLLALAGILRVKAHHLSAEESRIP
ncbi:YhfC family intramembrane metalloprotease [Candidatus Bathyarchaeota archaeon]|nr:YhfC family intramembrane metalloprotease [Candidatus Bathyarchaeota archaeon]